MRSRLTHCRAAARIRSAGPSNGAFLLLIVITFVNIAIFDVLVTKLYRLAGAFSTGVGRGFALATSLSGPFPGAAKSRIRCCRTNVSHCDLVQMVKFLFVPLWLLNVHGI